MLCCVVYLFIYLRIRLYLVVLNHADECALYRFDDTSIKELILATSCFLYHGYIIFGNLEYTFYVNFINTFTLMATRANKLIRPTWRRVLYSNLKNTDED